MKSILLENVESISLGIDTSSSNAGDWIIIRTIQGETYKTRGIISFTTDSLYGDLEQT